MKDHYVWRSFEEIERERDNAREQGRQDILDHLADEETGHFRKEVHFMIGRAANDLVQSAVVPYLRRAVYEYAHNRVRDETELFLRAMAPITYSVMDAKPRLRATQFDDGPISIIATVETPIVRHSVATVLPDLGIPEIKG